MLRNTKKWVAFLLIIILCYKPFVEIVVFSAFANEAVSTALTEGFTGEELPDVLEDENSPEMFVIEESSQPLYQAMIDSDAILSIKAGEENYVLGEWVNENVIITLGAEWGQSYEYIMTEDATEPDAADTEWKLMDSEDDVEFYLDIDEAFVNNYFWFRLTSEDGDPQNEVFGGVLVRIDKENPTSLMIQYNNDGIRELQATESVEIFYTESVLVTLYAKDSNSGIKEFIYAKNGGQPETIMAEPSLTEPDSYYANIQISPGFAGYLSINAVDNAGNWYGQEMVRDVSFAIDKAPEAPLVSMTSNGEPYLNNRWVSNDVVVEVRNASLEDTPSGIHHYEYVAINTYVLPSDPQWMIIDPEEIENTPTGINSVKFTIREDCNLYYFFRAISNTGMEGKTSPDYYVGIDKDIPPSIILSIEGANSNGWHRTTPVITIPNIVAPINKSQINVYYQIWKDGEEETSAPITLYQKNIGNHPQITGEGKYQLKVWAKNEAGNEGEKNVYEIKVDKSPPIALKIQYGTKYAIEFDQTQTVGNFFRNKVKVILTIDDQYSGIESFTYKKAGETEVKVLAQKVNGTEGSYQAELEIEPLFLGSIYANAIDYADNEYRVDLAQYAYVAVDDQSPREPEVEAKVGNNIYNQSWTNKDLDINVIADQANNVISGISHYEYTKTEDGPPSSQAVWTSVDMGDTIVSGGTRTKPSNADHATLKIKNDTYGSYYFRAISNTEVSGEVSEAVPVRVYKTKPAQPNISITNESTNTWYNADPFISIEKMEVLTNQKPRISIFYRLWKIDEDEANASDIIYQENGILTGEAPEIDQEGEYKVRVWSLDEAGNRNDQDVVKDIKLDKTPPKISIAYSDSYGIGDGIYFSSQRTAIVTVDDINFDKDSVVITYGSTSGKAYPEQLNDLSYWNQDAVTGKYTATLLFNPEDIDTGSERYSFQIQVSDFAGNHTASEQQEFIIDETIPNIDFAGTEDNLIAWNRDISLEAASGVSGIRKIEMFKNGNLVQTLFRDEYNSFDRSANTVVRDQIITIEENGTYTFRITSKAGISSEILPGAQFTNIDRQKPVLLVNQNGYTDGKWTSDDVTIKLVNKTNNLGTTVFFYKTSQNGQWVQFDGVLKFNDDVNTTYYFYAESEAQYRTRAEKGNIAVIDSAFNASLCKVESVNIKVDTTYPEELVVKYESFQADRFADSIAFSHFFINSMLVTLEAYDGFSGIQKFDVVLYNIDGSETFETYYVDNVASGTVSVEFLINPQFVGSIAVSASDMAGLSVPKDDTIQYASFAVDAKAPTSPIISSGDAKSGVWINKDTKLVIKDSKADSGISHYEYIKLEDRMPSDTDLWTILPEIKVTPADPVTPKNVLETELNIIGDTYATYYIRGVNNAGTKGQVSSYRAYVQKTLPPNGQLICEPPNEFGWYNHIPSIEIQVPSGTPAPVTLYYKLWDTAIGQSENSVSQVVFDGTNLPVFPADGEYVLWIWTMDEAGNRSMMEQDIRKEIKIDRLLPTVNIEFDNNNAENEIYYNAGRTATITVEELNFDPENCIISAQNSASEGTRIPSVSAWSSNGTSHRATVTFLEDGDYTLSISCTDKAGNAALVPTEQRFIVDAMQPELRIEGVINKTANRDSLSPKIIYSDANLDLDRITITLEGNITKDRMSVGTTTSENGVRTFTFNPIDVDDNYILTATIYDKAGNMTTESIIFSINQFGATFVFEQKEIQGQYTNIAFQPSIQIWNVDEITIVSFTVNGQEKSYQFRDGVITLDEEINVEGKYVIALDVKDAAGNASTMIPIEFYYDDVKPINQFTGAEDGKYYFQAVTAGIVIIDSGGFTTEVIVNDQVLTEEDYIFHEDKSIELKLEDVGQYHISVTSVDLAGNQSDTDELTFEISNNWFLKLWYSIVKFFSA